MKAGRVSMFAAEVRLERERVYGPRYVAVRGECCVYCGEAAEVGDHVPPFSAAHMFPAFFPFSLYSCCRQCNGELGTYPGACLKDRGGWLFVEAERRLWPVMAAWEKDQSPVTAAAAVLAQERCEALYCWVQQDGGERLEVCRCARCAEQARYREAVARFAAQCEAKRA